MLPVDVSTYVNKAFYCSLNSLQRYKGQDRIECNRSFCHFATVSVPAMAQDITLLWGAGSRCWRIMIALEEKGLAGYNQKLLSFDKGEHKSPEVLSINPRGQVGRVDKGGTNLPFTV